MKKEFRHCFVPHRNTRERTYQKNSQYFDRNIFSLDHVLIYCQPIDALAPITNSARPQKVEVLKKMCECINSKQIAKAAANNLIWTGIRSSNRCACSPQTRFSFSSVCSLPRNLFWTGNLSNSDTSIDGRRLSASCRNGISNYVKLEWL